jgi:hypothetical protein
MVRKRPSDADLEAKYQAELIPRIENRFPGCWVLKNDSGYLQGIPDLIVLYRNKWAMLEVKAYEGAEEQPNQGWYIGEFDNMSFGAFIYPENEEEVLHDLQQAFQ